MNFELKNDVDKGPIVRWMANRLMDISSWLARTSSPYADMYTAVWDDYEDDDEESDLFTPHNQMGLFDNFEPLPQFHHLTDELL